MLLPSSYLKVTVFHESERHFVHLMSSEQRQQFRQAQPKQPAGRVGRGRIQAIGQLKSEPSKAVSAG